MGSLALIISKYWKQILIVSAVIFILWYIWYRGKKTGESGKPKVIGLPDDIFDPNNPNVKILDGNKIRRIATTLHDDMDGINFGHDDQIYQELATLSNTEFTAVYNDFNERYYSEGEGTLKEWITNEVFGGWEVIDDIILPRFAAQNLN